jgi:hypothetical protein
MLSPKSQFLADKQKADKVRQLLDDPDMKSAILAAFNQFCWTLPGSDNPQSGWNANCRRSGARGFIDELTSITDEQQPRKQMNTNLEPHV